MLDFPLDSATITSLQGKLLDPCFVCQLPSRISDVMSPGKNIHDVFCSRCGSYKLSKEVAAISTMSICSPTQVANASGYLRENSPFVIKDEDDIAFLAQLATPSVATKAHKLLAQMAKRHPLPGALISARIHGVDPQLNHFLETLRTNRGRYSSDVTADKTAMEMFPWLSFAWCQSEVELNFLFQAYLVNRMNFLHAEGSAYGYLNYIISTRGWEQLQTQGVSDSSTGFVAMWFSGEVASVWEHAIYPAIKEAGYNPLRIDKKHHNNKIDDEIMASIRGAKFVIADFTGQRGGVYYEAGFAGGLGKPVIWTVRDDHLDGVHFDTRQFNHILWSREALPQFKEELKMRILATLGQGPVKIA